MKDTNTYKWEAIGNSVQIYINDVLHIAFKRSDLKGIQSWKMGRKGGMYCSELQFVSNKCPWTMELEYDNENISKAVLNILSMFI